MYALFAAAQIALNSVLPNVPFSLGLCFSLLICGTNIFLTPALYVLCSAVYVDWVASVLSLFEGGFLALTTLIYRKTGKKIGFEAAAYMVIALAPFIVFARRYGIDSLYFTQSPYIIKSVAAFAAVVFTFFCFKTVYALLFRLCRCRLGTDEIICVCIFFTVLLFGVLNLIKTYAYICLIAASAAFFSRVFKTPSALIAGIVAALPLCMYSLTLSPICAAVLICLFSLIFSCVSRFTISLAAAAGGALYMYAEGLYYAGAPTAALYTVLLVILCVCPALPSEKNFERLNALLTLKAALPRAESKRQREYIAEKLYKMSEVFREIERAFNALDDGPDDGAMKKRMLTEAADIMCRGCDRAAICKGTKVYKGFASLIETGCLKGKVSFVDITADVTQNCKNPSALTETVNKLLYEYRKSTLEAENARSGRKLLAEQAEGVAKVLKERAVEFTRETGGYTSLEKKIKKALALNGVSCPEIDIRDGAEFCIYITLLDCKNFPAVKEIIEDAAGVKLIAGDKTEYDGHKCVYRLVKPPAYDAAFGVAFCVKDGEKASGDTHSVIKINEHRFLMALSDGMGSGEYARKVSETAISLIEAFCRAEMPQDTMLDTVNKLLCFNRDERFTCIDAATVDLNTLTASLIKIGSPVGLIVRKGEIKVLESRSLPLGILDSLTPATSKEQLKKDDLIVFMSDGITSAFGSSAELYEFAGSLKPLNPQALADKILAEARSRCIGVPDDMTVLCVRIFEKGEDK